MIKSACVSATALLAEKLSASGVLLEPYSGNTPLSDLMNASYNTLVDDPVYVDQASASDIVYRLAEASGNVGMDKRCLHDDALNKATEVISKAVRFDLHLAKNVVNPLIRSVLDSVHAELRQRPNNMATVLSVVPDKYEAIWSNALLTDLVAPYSQSAAFEIKEGANIHPQLPSEAVLALLKTGSTRLDADIDKFVKEVGVEFVTQVYTQFFVLAMRDEEGESALNSMVTLDTGLIGRKRTLLVHLMARRLAAAPLEGINMNLSSYELLMAEVVNHTGRIINRVFESRDRTGRAKTLVQRWPAPNAEYMVRTPELGQLVVNYDIYEDWLKAGGTPEILFGAAVSDRNDGYDQLLAKAEEYTAIWTSRASMVKSAQRSNVYNNTISAIKISMAKEIVALDEVGLAGRSPEALQNRLLHCLGLVSIDCISDLYECIRGLVCDVLYPHTNAKTVLTRIDSVAKANPELSIREAGLLAVIDIVTEWVAKLVCATR